MPSIEEQRPVLVTSVHGAINMLGLAKRTHARILQASTSEVYGDPEIHPLVSSLQALGGAVVEETELGNYRNLIIEGTEGKGIIMAIPGTTGEMLLTVIANSQLLFGIFLVLCRNTCQAMSVRLTPID